MPASFDEHLRQLRAGDFDSAFHGLIDLPAEIVPALIAAYRAEGSAFVRRDILRVLFEFHRADALPLLADALRDPSPDIWKEALNGVVHLESAEAIRLLEAVLDEQALTPHPSPGYREWILEALEQTREAHERKESGQGL